MKKAAIVLLLAVTVFLLISCGEKENSLNIIKGKIENNVYANEYLDLKFLPGLNWSFSDPDVSNDEKTTTDMYAIETKTGEYVQIRIEDLSMSFGGILYDEKDYLEIIKGDLEASKTPAYTINEVRYITLAQREFTELSVKEKDNENIGYRYLVEKADNYMVTIIISDYMSDTGDGVNYLGYETILSMFSELS